MKLYVVEHEYPKPITDEEHNDIGKRTDPCLAQYGVTWKGTLLSEDRKKAFCEFMADTQEQVVNALRSADCAFVAVWPAHKYTPLG